MAKIGLDVPPSTSLHIKATPSTRIYGRFPKNSGNDSLWPIRWTVGGVGDLSHELDLFSVTGVAKKTIYSYALI